MFAVYSKNNLISFAVPILLEGAVYGHMLRACFGRVA